MTKGLFAAIGALLLAGSVARAQMPGVLAEDRPVPTGFGAALSPPDPAPSYGVGSDFNFPAPAHEADAFGLVSFSADYLSWWVRKGSSSGPLLTRGDPNDNFAGAVGRPGTVPLFGDHGLDYGNFAGVRINAAVGLTPDLALEGNYLTLERRSLGASAASDANGNPTITRPVINDQNGLQEAYLTSFPGALAARSDVVSHTQLQGYEINLAANAARGDGYRLDLMLGYRYLNLREDLLFTDSLTPLTSDFLTFQGGPADPPSTVTDFDGFRTRNQFYGGQVGARWQQTFGNLEVGVTGKVALGATDQRVEIDGMSALNTPGVGRTLAPGGILAQATNSGTHSRSEFSVVPEVGVNVGWQVTPWLSANVGYTFLYWSDVARPGAQIDRHVNPFQVPTDQNFGMGPAGGHPSFVSHSSDFWAQGVNFGLTLRF